MGKQGLEGQLAALTQEFVARLVDTLRNASFAEVAALSGPLAQVSPPREAPAARPPPKVGAGTRQNAAGRAALAERIVRALDEAGQPMPVSTLARQLGVPADRLAAPLRDLRGAGRVHKHGDKRSTTYSVA